MKVWEHARDKAVERAVRETEQVFRRFAENGSCSGIDCVDCPFTLSECGYGKPYPHNKWRAEKLNEEYDG